MAGPRPTPHARRHGGVRRPGGLPRPGHFRPGHFQPGHDLCCGPAVTPSPTLREHPSAASAAPRPAPHSGWLSVVLHLGPGAAAALTPSYKQ